MVVRLRCGAASCPGIIGGGDGEEQEEGEGCSSEPDEEEGEGNKRSPMNMSSKGRHVQRDMLGKVVRKKKEEKEWAPGMNDRWSDDEFEDDTDDGGGGGSDGGRGDRTGGRKAKRSGVGSGGSRKRHAGSSSAGASADARRWQRIQAKNLSPFEAEVEQLLDDTGGTCAALTSCEMLLPCHTVLCWQGFVIQR